MKEWSFEWNEDSLLLQMKEGLQMKDSDGLEVIYVGSLGVRIL